MASPTSKPDADVTFAYEPDFALKKILGKKVNLNEVFTPEKIQACQKLVDDASSSFFSDVQPDLDKLENIVKKLTEKGQGNVAIFEEIGHTTNDIRGQAGLFGFPLIYKICIQIIECCRAAHKSPVIRFSHIKELIAALRLSVHHKITDDGGEIGRAILMDLQKYYAGQPSS